LTHEEQLDDLDRQHTETIAKWREKCEALEAKLTPLLKAEGIFKRLTDNLKGHDSAEIWRLTKTVEGLEATNARLNERLAHETDRLRSALSESQNMLRKYREVIPAEEAEAIHRMYGYGVETVTSTDREPLEGGYRFDYPAIVTITRMKEEHAITAAALKVAQKEIERLKAIPDVPPETADDVKDLRLKLESIMRIASDWTGASPEWLKKMDEDS
jgi:hypothetical protein